LIDVEAWMRMAGPADFQQRVDFECEDRRPGAAAMTAGTNSITHTYLDLECGVNRVTIRAGRIQAKSPCSEERGIESRGGDDQVSAAGDGNGYSARCQSCGGTIAGECSEMDHGGNRGRPENSAVTPSAGAGKSSALFIFRTDRDVYVETDAQNEKFTGSGHAAFQLRIFWRARIGCKRRRAMVRTARWI